MNAGSIKNKANSYHDYIIGNNIDVMAFTETWLYADEKENAVHINELVPKQYCFKHIPRQDGRIAGGVGILHHKNIKVIVRKSKNSVCQGMHQFECMECVLSVNNDPRSNIILIVVYRPPPTQANGLKLKSFWREWKRMLSTLAKDHKTFIIVGDLNFHLDILCDPNTRKFKNILEELNLVQLVGAATHTAGHTLDVVVTQPENTCIVPGSISVCDPGISASTGNITRVHHFAVTFSLDFCKPKPVYKSIMYRNLKNLDKEAFLKDLDSSKLESMLLEYTCIDQMVEKFLDTTVSILDKHAPLLSKTIVERSSLSWYTPALTHQKQIKRKLERRWVKSGLESHRREYRKQCAIYAKLLYDTRIQDSQERIAACEKNKSKLFKLCRSIIDAPNTSISIEGCDSNKETADAFSTYFKTKTEKIESDLETESLAVGDTLPSTSSKLNLMTQYRNVPKLSHFKLVTPEDIEKLILAAKIKSCSLDLVPVPILKTFARQFSHIIAIIINKSLEYGSVPKYFKSAIIFPAIKEYNLDNTNPSSYRPVSNLPFLSKLLEKVVYTQLEQHLSDYNLLPISQSAYRKKHSTETSLLRVSNDILKALNHGKSTLLVKLDISAAFDTVNHQMLLDRYASLFGLSDIVLAWFSSYLTERTQAVQIGSDTSAKVQMNCGFAQGSTLGGPKYIMFTTPLDELTQLHEVSHEAYADDSNLYVSFDMRNTADTAACFAQMENCLCDIKRWMLKNRLKLNCGKTEAILFHPPRTVINTEQHMVVKMDNLKITISHEIKSLGVIFDSKMKLKKQVNSTTKTAFLHLRKISKVRNQLNKSITETLVNTFITSRLDYCNSLFCSLPNNTLKKLQCVQNAAAKMIMLKKKRDHVTPLLRELHWLPVKLRSQFKILVLTWRIMNNMAPANIAHLISVYRPTRNLRSSSERFLVRPAIPRNSYGHRAFYNLSPFLWNSIPTAIRNTETIGEFKAKLKTHFFIEHFGSGN